MAPYRPTNVNKRAYPGNARVTGPTCQATCVATTNTCCSSTNTCSACTCYPLNLGCRCSCCACPCCNICCSCTETVCTRTIPSGIYKRTEQYDASIRDAWRASSCSCGPATCLCCTNVGVTCVTNVVDCVGFFIYCGPSTNKWFVSPYCTQVSRSGYLINDAVLQACTCMGNCGWFVPSYAQMQDPAYNNRSYWDQYDVANYWTTTFNNSCPYYINMSSGTGSFICPDYVTCARAFRCST